MLLCLALTRGGKRMFSKIHPVLSYHTVLPILLLGLNLWLSAISVKDLWMFPSVSHKVYFSVLSCSCWTLPSLLFDWNSFCLQPAFCWEDNNSGICSVQNLVQRDYCQCIIYTHRYRGAPPPPPPDTHTSMAIDWLINDCLYSTILCSWADSLHSHVILPEWLAFYSN